MILGNILVALAGVVHTVFQLAWWVLIARIVLSWINPRPSNDSIRTVVSTIYQITDPVLDRMRRLLPFLVVGGLDLSPIALFLALGFVDQVVTNTLYGLAASM